MKDIGSRCWPVWPVLLMMLGLLTAPGSLAASDDAHLSRMAGEGQLACGSTESPTSDACLSETDADTPWRHIGVSNTLSCPLAPTMQWSTQRLFQPIEGNPEPALARYCVYEALQFEPAIASIDALRCSSPGSGTPCLVQLNPDSASVAMMSQDTAHILWEPLRTFFREQVGVVGALPDAPQNVLLSVIDTEPTGFNEDRNGAGVSQHGFTLLNMIRDSICPATGSCAVALRSALGLPMQRCELQPGFCIDPTVGGYVGTIGQLAQAIYGEVDAWLQSPINQLIINLSLGWDPLFGNDQPISNSRAAAQAVYRALEYASCHGALVVAATGNRVTGPGVDEGPLLPAGWEDVPAPTGDQCMSQFGIQPAPATLEGSYRPLIYAAGAIDKNAQPLESRRFGEPRLVAYGDHAVAPVNEPAAPEPSQILTGSSVSAAVVSAAAAAAWHFSNSAGPHQIMQALYDSGAGVGRMADYCLSDGSSCQDVRNVRICEAVDKACADLNSGNCPVLDCAQASDVVPGISEVDLVALFAEAPVVALDTLENVESIDECRPGYVLHSTAGSEPVNPCPQLQFYGAQATPWTDGQPEGQFCPTCTDVYHSPGRLYLEIDASLTGTLSDVTVVCGNNAYQLDGELQAGNKLVISEIPEACEFEEVAVAYSLDNGSPSLTSVASPSLLLEDRDADDIQDGLDNCVDVANNDQTDADGDGYGNACDADYNNDCIVNFLDLSLFGEAFTSTDPVIDLNDDGVVNFLDLAIFGDLVFAPPGPSGVGVCVN